jgi:putative spermidine/putrescine transport system substrate-binding protein
MKLVKGIILLISVVFITACSTTETSTTQADEKLIEEEWSEIESLAEGTEVRIFMWGGDEGINRYMDDWVAPSLKEEYGVNLVRIPMDTQEILQKLLTEKRAGTDTGTVDIFWLNGKNFKNAKDNDLIWNSFTDKLPNYQAFVDTEGLDSNYDFGTPVEGLEAPWGKVQFVFKYDSEQVETPPTNFTELKEWMKENPGKFTYPEPTDFTGNVFLRHLLYETIGGPEPLLEKGFDEEFVNEQAKQMWSYLTEIEPYLWRHGETYPQSLTDLDRLYSQGEVWMTMGYNEARAESLIQDGTFPESTKTFVLESGSIGNTHFLSIPFNSPNKAGALAAINYMLSPEAQLAKMDPSMWGENMALDPTKLTEEHAQWLAEVNRGASVLPAETLQEHLLPEVDVQYVEWIKEKWLHEVVQSRQ